VIPFLGGCKASASLAHFSTLPFIKALFLLDLLNFMLLSQMPNIALMMIAEFFTAFNTGRFPIVVTAILPRLIKRTASKSLINSVVLPIDKKPLLTLFCQELLESV